MGKLSPNDDGPGLGPRRGPWSLRVHFGAILVVQAAYAFAYVNVPYLRTAIVVPQIFRLVFWTLPVLIYLALQKRPIADDLRLREGAGRGFLWGLAIGLVILVGNVLVAFKLTGAFRMNFDIGLNLWVGPVALVGLSEEVLFRGFFLQKLAERMTFDRANLLQTGLFVLIHVPGWILLGQFHFPRALGLIGSVAVIALLLGWLLRRTRSLWACMVCHSLNNLASFIVRPI
jgi:uncharacterized protein